MNSDPVDVHAIRRNFAFPALDRIVTNNAASAPPPRELLARLARYPIRHQGDTLSQPVTGRRTARTAQ